MTNNTLNDILLKVAAVVSQAVEVDDTTDEYALWRTYANMAQNEWAELYEWPQLYREYNTQTSTASGNVTIAMPANYRKLASYPKITSDGVNTYEFSKIEPTKRGQYLDTDRYVYELSTNSQTYLVVNPSPLVSGASIMIPYWRSIASLASPSDQVECQNADYLTQRIIGYIWEAREDSRFPQAKAEAQRILSNLLEFENSKGEADSNTIQTIEEAKFNFRIGRN